MLTVQSLLDELGLELAAGAGAAESPVRWVHISELEDPTPVPLRRRADADHRDPADRRRQAARLRQAARSHNLAGLGFGTGFGHRKLPKALVDEAAKQDFPLFEVPYSMPFIALTEKAFTRLVNEQYEVLQRGIAVQRRLERLVLEERGLDEIAATISSAVGGTVMILRRARRAHRRPRLPPRALRGGVAAIRRESALARGDGHPFVPAHSAGRRPRARPARDLAGRRPAAGLGRDRPRLRRARRLRAADPPAGGCGRRARADAPPGRAGDGAPARRRRACRRPRRAGSSRPSCAAASSRSGSVTRRRCSSSRSPTRRPRSRRSSRRSPPRAARPSSPPMPLGAASCSAR